MPATKHRGEGFQKRVRPEDGKPVKMAVIRSTEAGGLACSCGGWVSYHPRRKVREDAAQRHLDKRHGGSGLWF